MTERERTGTYEGGAIEKWKPLFDAATAGLRSTEPTALPLYSDFMGPSVLQLTSIVTSLQRNTSYWLRFSLSTIAF